MNPRVSLVKLLPYRLTGTQIRRIADDATSSQYQLFETNLATYFIFLRLKRHRYPVATGHDALTAG